MKCYLKEKNMYFPFIKMQYSVLAWQQNVFYHKMSFENFWFINTAEYLQLIVFWMRPIQLFRFINIRYWIQSGNLPHTNSLRCIWTIYLNLSMILQNHEIILMYFDESFKILTTISIAMLLTHWETPMEKSI